MILAVDVDYRGSEAVIAGLTFDDWTDDKPRHCFHSVVKDIKPYEPGSFYKRELPCIMTLVQEYGIVPDLIVIDGYVYLGKPSIFGLGMHLFNALERKIPVVGVAKKPFKGTAQESELFRGESLRPLYITAVGMELEEAKICVHSMHGKHRMPTLLKQVDRECRKSSYHREV